MPQSCQGLVCRGSSCLPKQSTQNPPVSTDCSTSLALGEAPSPCTKLGESTLELTVVISPPAPGKHWHWPFPAAKCLAPRCRCRSNDILPQYQLLSL